jgi:integrase
MSSLYRADRHPGPQLNTALRRLGFTKDEMTSHGFRTMASTRLNEMNRHPDAIERQLAHKPKNQFRAAYNQAQHLPERIRMMQSSADYIDDLRSNIATDKL